MFSGRGIYRLRRRRLLRKIKSVLGRIGLAIFVIGFISVVVIITNFFMERRNTVIGEHLGGETGLSRSGRQAQEAILEGRYDVAQQIIDEGLVENTEDVALQELRQQLSEELRVDFKFNYLPDRRKLLTTKSMSDELVLTPQDPYYLSVHASDDCYLYLLQIDAEGHLQQLFPNSKYVPTRNPIPPGPLRIPDGPDWFYLDDVSGSERIYLVAARWRHQELEELGELLGSEKDATRQEHLLDRLVSRLMLEDRATDDLPGLVFGTFQFTNGGSSRH